MQDLWTYIEYLEYKEICCRDAAPKKDEGSSTKSLQSDEASLSILQKSYLKIKPFVKELLRRMIPNESESEAVHNGEGKIADRVPDEEGVGSLRSEEGGLPSDGEEPIDLRNFLGFLNQRFNYEFLNISTMMQLSPLDVSSLFGRRDHELILSR